jgi:NAD-dependent DNA ligase
MSQNITVTSTAQVSQPIHHATPLVEFDDLLTDDEIEEFESRISRDHDDATYWMSGGGVNV